MDEINRVSLNAMMAAVPIKGMSSAMSLKQPDFCLKKA